MSSVYQVGTNFTSNGESRGVASRGEAFMGSDRIQSYATPRNKFTLLLACLIYVLVYFRYPSAILLLHSNTGSGYDLEDCDVPD